MAPIFEYEIASILKEQTEDCSVPPDNHQQMEDDVQEFLSLEDVYDQPSHPQSSECNTDKQHVFGLAQMPNKLFDSARSQFTDFIAENDVSNVSSCSSGKKKATTKKKKEKKEPYPQTQENIEIAKQQARQRKKEREADNHKKAHGLNQDDFIKTLRLDNGEQLTVTYDLGTVHRPFRSECKLIIERNHKKIAFNVFRRRLIGKRANSPINEEIVDVLTSKADSLFISSTDFCKKVRAGTNSMLISINDGTELCVKFLTSQTGGRNLLLEKMDVILVNPQNRDNVFITKCTKNNF